MLLAGLLAAGRQLAGYLPAAEFAQWSPLLENELELDCDELLRAGEAQG